MLIALLMPAALSAARLADGTLVRVRLLHPITSETSKTGQHLEFVVTRDVVVDGEILISRGTAVTGVIVKARRASRGFFGHNHPVLAFKFQHTVAANGPLIRLRASVARHQDDRVIVDRFGQGHQLHWAGEADVFEAYVDGGYEW